VNLPWIDPVSARVAGYELNPVAGMGVVADQLWFR